MKPHKWLWILLGIDKALLIGVLEEIPSPMRALAELRRVLKPDGIVSITAEFIDPDYWFLFETIRQLETAGFTLVKRFGNLWRYTANFRLVRQKGVYDEPPNHVQTTTST